MAKERITIELEEDNEIKMAHVARYKFAKEFVRNKKVMDVVCGTGYGSHILIKAGAKEVIGLDNSNDAIEYAKNSYSAPGLEFHLDDVFSLNQYKQNEIIISFETIEHLIKPEHFMQEVVKAISTGGMFIGSTPNRVKGSFTDKPENEFHHQEWNFCEFDAMLSFYFEEVQLFGQYFHFPKRWFPFSRTFFRMISKVLCPDIFKYMNKHEVNHFPRTRLKIVPDFIVAVCRKPKF